MVSGDDFGCELSQNQADEKCYIKNSELGCRNFDVWAKVALSSLHPLEDK